MDDRQQIVTLLARAGQYDDAARVLLHSVGLTSPDECRHERAQPGDRFCQACGQRLAE